MVTRIVSMALALSLMGAAAWAEDAPRPDPRAACAADVKQFCAKVEVGEGRIVKCLRDNESKLSQACKDARTAMRGRMERQNEKK